MLQKLKQTLKASVGYNITKYIWTLGRAILFYRSIIIEASLLDLSCNFISLLPAGIIGLQEPTLAALYIKFNISLEHLLGSTASVLGKKSYCQATKYGNI